MTDSFRSQVGQDRWVAETLAFKRDGYFVDIGAYDGVHISNSYYLEKELGWRGICAEANFELYQKLVMSRSVACDLCAVNSYNGICKFQPQDLSGKVQDAGQVVPSKTLEAILDQHAAPKIVDYLSLDVEGLEFEILKVFPFDKYSFKLITVEHNLYLNGPQLKTQLKEVLTANGYEITRENVADSGNAFEDWYVHSGFLRSTSTSDHSR
jgi:FkbM family methyltransferase